MENTTRTPCSQQRTHEIQDTIFREHVLFSFFYSREKILCVDDFITLLFVIKKGFENTLFGIREGGRYPPSRTIIYIYIYIYICKGKKEHPKGITIHTVSSQFFLFETENKERLL